MAECPFCGCDPYHYVDIGVGSVAVAVTCCDLGAEYFDHRSTGGVTISREDFVDICSRMVALLRRGRSLEDALQELLDQQNGPPLIRDADKWRLAVARAEAVLQES